MVCVYLRGQEGPRGGLRELLPNENNVTGLASENHFKKKSGKCDAELIDGRDEMAMGYQPNN